MKPLVVVSNRTPGRKAAAGGLAVALKKVLSERDGFWFGWSGQFSESPSREASFEDVNGIRVGTIDLNRQDYRGYYEGYSNSVLWPAFHQRLDLVNIDPVQYEAYMNVNRAFAQALAPELTPEHVIWVHDYHLIPLGRELRRLGVTNKIGFFLHIPLPDPETFSAVPHQAELLECIAAYDLTGLQAERDVSALHQQEEMQDLPSVWDTDYGSPAAIPQAVEAFPIGTDPQAFRDMLETEDAQRTMALVSKSLAGRDLIVGVDRLDYSKGLPERVAAYERLLELFPEWRREVHMLQIAPPSRGTIAEYQKINDELDVACGRVMGRFSEPDWSPLNYVKRTYPQTALAGIYHLARVALVTPLRDGMNLVAHEFVACQDPEDPGVLILSRFAGAAELFPEALMVSPHDIDEMAHALDKALRMTKRERKERWQGLIKTVEERSVDAWASAFLNRLSELPPWQGWRKAPGDGSTTGATRAAG